MVLKARQVGTPGKPFTWPPTHSHTNMACVHGLTAFQRTRPNQNKRSFLHIFTTLLVLQFLLTFAQGQGQGGPDEADRPPVDEREVFQIREGLPSGTEVGRINVQAGLRYKFSENPGVFHLNPETGLITTTTVIDREELGLPDDKFDLFVQSTPSARHLIEVRINVLDVNDNSPRFAQSNIKISFSERDTAGTQVILVTATDKDVGINDVTGTYKIMTDSEDIRRKFRLVLLTDTSIPLLYLENLVVLDREDKSSYQLNISAQDGGNPPRFGFLLVNISVTDINDNPPLFDQSDYSSSLNETAPPGTSVSQVRATDQDAGANGDITYRLVHDDYNQFTIDSKSGVITTEKKLVCQQSCSGPNQGDSSSRRCDQKTCVVTVEASDGGQPPQLGRAYVAVNLIDENDHSPVIQYSYTGKELRKYATVDEGSKEDTVVAIVSITDGDEGLNGQTTVRIARGNERKHFRLDSKKNLFNFIRVAGKLDRERVSKYNLTIEARDLGVPQRTSTSYLIIVVNDVNDHKPEFQQPFYTSELSEVVPVGSFVASITATDNDTGINAQITYTILSGDELGWFKIDNSSGLVTTRKRLDHEQKSYVFLRILAEDGGSPPDKSYTNLTISIWDENDETPTFSSDVYYKTLSESTPVNTLIITLNAEDNDQGKNGSVHYHFDPEVNQKYPGSFLLDQGNGRITLMKQVDRETHEHYVMKVIAQDGGEPALSSTATVYINVTDINDNSPVFYPTRYYASVLENQPAHTQVIQIHASDRDTGENSLIYYTLIYQQDEERMFKIDINTGRITTTQQLDRERRSMYNLRVGAHDLGSPQREAEGYATVEITVNDLQDTAPDFSSPRGYSFTIQEDDGDSRPSLGRMVGRVQATTRDVRGTITYSITSGDKEGVFTINADNGVITVVSEVDREVKAFYQLTVIASGGALHGETTVNITVTDLNDNKPDFGKTSAEAFVVENWPVGHEVYLAETKDEDAGNNGKVTYTLVSQSVDLFQVDTSTGMIYLVKPLSQVSQSNFQVTVSATDNGIPPRSSLMTVDIMRRDVNDHTPVFEQSSYEVTVSESDPVNDHIYRIIAKDADLGLNGQLTYRITSGNEDGKFGIFPDGVLYIAKPLDRETRDVHLLIVVVEDMGVEPRSSQANVSIYIKDANDNRPVFSNYTYEMQVKENKPIGSFVGTVSATDADVGLNAEMSYTIEGKGKPFQIHPKTGVITTKQLFDRESLQSEGGDVISFVVIATDSGEKKLSEQVVVNVHILDDNDNPPKFVQDLYAPSLYENTDVNTLVVRVSAEDADSGPYKKITYSIQEGNEGGEFAIDSATGQISMVGKIDREKTPEYQLEVQASDGGRPQLNATAVVRISISDTNDNPPQFQKTDAIYDVIENTQIGTFIAHVSAMDPDFGQNAEVTYEIKSGNGDTTFHIDTNTGKLYLAGKLDFELKRKYNLTIIATDNGIPSLSSERWVAINVLDFNDNAPSFDSSPVVRQIEEGVQIGTSITLMRANDPDAGVNGEVRYSISKQEPPGQLFTIDPLTGLIKTKGDIDREASNSYKLTVLATDQSLPVSMRKTAEKLVTVLVKDLNDNAPKFVSMNAVAILLGTEPGVRIAVVVALDVDEAESGEVQYSIISGSQGLFRIDPDNGNLYVEQSLGSQAKVYKLTIQAQDRGVNDIMGRKSSTFQLTIFTKSNINNGPAFSESSYSGQVYENEPAGKSILTVSASQPSNSNAKIEYYITGIKSSNIEQSRYFQIDPTTGVISTTEVLDREKGFSEFVCTVYVLDTNSAVSSSRVTEVHIKLLDQNDSPPIFVPSEYNVDVREDVNPGHDVINVIATDADEQGALLYKIVDGNDDNTFSVDATRGTLTLIKPLDREEQASYTVHIEASDNVQSSRTRVHVRVLDVNDQQPTFSRTAYSWVLPEDTRPGTTVGRVATVDQDLGKNGEVTYSMVSRWGRDKFSLSPNSGVITVIDNLDYEEIHHYVLIIRAEDRGVPALSSTVTVYVNVEDVNDNAPVFDPSTYSDEVMEDAPKGTSIITVTATDIDSGDNSKMAYSIVGGDSQQQFTIEPETGVIRTAGLLDRESQAYYNLAVMASDQAKSPAPRHSTTTMVSIILKDANDNAPQFVDMGQITVMENAPAGTSVALISATDQDEGRNSYVEYRLTGDSRSLFSLGPVDGVLRVNQRLDREQKDEYDLHVTVTDKGVPAQTTAATLKVKVGDDNDNNPLFDPKQYEVEISEAVKVGTSILEVTATDLDIDLNGDIRYVIISGDDNQDFRLDSHTGELHIMKKLDYERKKTYTLSVKAEDQGVTPRSDYASIEIKVTDVNDNAPTFVNLPYVAYVRENIANFPVHVLSITVRDEDTGYGGRVQYNIMNGDRSLFSINRTTGEIEALRSFDREEQASYELIIRVVDQGRPRLSSTCLVTILVQDVNDQTPRFQHSRYVARVMENEPPPRLIMRVSATDADVGQNAKIVYSLDNTYSGRFGVHLSTGEVFAHQMLNREVRSEYDLVVRASDSGMIARSSTASIHLTVEDKNNNVPQFTQEIYRAYIRDPTSSGMFVVGVTATDPDLGNNGQIVYSLMSGSDRANFIIDAQSGIITASRRLTASDRTSRTYQLLVRATDKGQNPLSIDASVEVQLLSPTLSGFPSLTAPQRSFTLSEMVEVGHIIVRVSGITSRSGVSLAYRIAGGNIDQSFAVTPLGEVKVNRQLDYERTHNYNLWVEVYNEAETSLADFLSLSINIEDSNDNPPIFDKTFYEVTVTEEELPPNSVIVVTAADADSGDNGRITYEIISGNVNNAFFIDRSHGQIRTNQKLDREEQAKYSLEVQATDHGSPSFSAVTIIDITVADINDKPPVFTQHFQDTQIPENIPIGSSILKITSSDGDLGSNAQHSYSFTANPGNKFTIDRQTGIVQVASRLDFETKSTYILQVSTNDGAHNADTPVTIRVSDINDNAPRFTKSRYIFDLVEGQAPNTFIGTVSASDSDSQGPNSDVYYMFKRPTKDFHVDVETGKIYSRNRLVFKKSGGKASPENEYRMLVVAADRGEPPMSSEVTISVVIKEANKFSPVFEKKFYDEALPENAPVGYSVVTLKASDRQEDGTLGEVEYSKSGGNGTNVFNINRNTGVIISTSPVSGHRGRTYILRVTARDRGYPPRSTNVDVKIQVAEVNRNGPTFVGSPASFQVSVPENTELQSVIARVTASDPDIGNNGLISYLLTNVPPTDQFEVDASQGYIRVVQPLDYEKNKTVYLNITAQDRGLIPREVTRVFTVQVTDVNDNPPAFDKPVFDAYVRENTPSGTEVYRASAHDVDINPRIEYHILGNNEATDKFTVESTTGIIRSQGSIDYELKNEYDILIKAMNPGTNLYSTANIHVHVTGANEYVPHFDQPEYQFVVSESAKPGDVVGSVHAQDQDGGPDGQVFYYLVADSHLRGFQIDAQSGAIAIASQIDRESTSQIELTVLAKNTGPIQGNDTTTCKVIVLVRDANDAPIFTMQTYQVSVPENSPRGSNVVKVVASDSDLQSSFKDFTYKLLTTAGEVPFSIESNTGWIAVKGSLDRETIPVYNLTVLATDSGSPPMTGSATVKVQVTDVNDNGPYFEPRIPEGHVTENKAPYTEVALTLSSFTMDPDTPANQGPYKYRLLQPADLFDVGLTSSLVKAKVRLDREANPEYLLTIEVSDSGTPAMSSTLTAKVSVRDENDNPSIPRPLDIIVQAYNGSYPGGVVADVKPLDPDSTGDWQCRITQGDLSVLQIRSGCQLQAVKVLSGRQFNLNISGSDGIHQSVPYSAKVRFLSFDQQAVRNSIAIKVGVHKVEYFLGSFYTKFLAALDGALTDGSSPVLFSMSSRQGFTVVHLASKQTNGNYMSSSQLEAILFNKKAALESQSGLTIDSLNYKPCDGKPCQNGGQCSYENKVTRYHTVDSTSLVFTAPELIMDVRCLCPQSFTGKFCESPINSCDNTLCQNGGTCLTSGQDTRCLCPSGYTGATCGDDVNECEVNNPCRHGGTCNNFVGSYRCDCVSAYAGKHCEFRNDYCSSSPCQNGAKCVTDGNGFRCECSFGQRGSRCEVASKGFLPLSFMEFTLPWDRRRNSVVMEFATVKENALLLYGSGTQTGGMGSFIALEIISGKLRFSFALGGNRITRITVNKRVSDGSWYRIEANRNEKVGTLRVTSCIEGEASCQTCEDGDPTCYNRVEHQSSFSELHLEGDRINIGGVRSINSLLTIPGQVSSSDFVGCLRAVTINDADLLRMTPEDTDFVTEGCPRDESLRCKPGVCQNDGVCVDEWALHRCDCKQGYMGPDCSQVAEPFAFGPDAMVVYRQKEEYKREQLFSDQMSSGSKRRRRSVGTSTSTVSITFSTGQEEGLLFYSATGSDSTAIEVYDGQVFYHSEVRGQVYKVSSASDKPVADSEWHNVTVSVKGTTVTLTLDTEASTKKFISPVHDLLDLDLTSLSIGGSKKKVTTPDGASLIKGFEGCISEFRLNGEVLPFSGSTDRFVALPEGGGQSDSVTCAGGITGAATGPGVHVAVIVVVVFIAIVLIVVVATILVIRMRRKNKEAAKNPKVNGSVSKSNGAILDKADNRSHQDSGFTENGDLPEEMIIQQHVQRELASRSFNEREVREQFGSSRPDLVSPEMGGVSGGLDNIGVENNGYIEEPPEHYDIDNASSIAPSDLVDVTGHYKRYRQSGNNNTHQYNVPAIKGRHTPSPANVLGGIGPSKPYPIRESPLTVNHRQSPAVNMLAAQHRDSPGLHASTPLARGLSPLSHMNGMASRQHTPNPHPPPPISPVGLNNLSRSSPAVGDHRTTSPLSHNQLARGQSPMHLRDKRMSPLPQGINSTRSTPINGLYPSNASNSSTGYHSDRNHLPNGHPPRPNSRVKQPINQLAMRGTPTRGLTVEDVERLNARSKPSPVSTLDVGSSSSDDMPRKNLIARSRTPVSPFDPGRALQMEPPPDSSSDDGSNDSFTCSEFEYDNDKVKNDYTPNRNTFPKLMEVSENDDTDVSRTFTPNGSDSNREGSLSTFFSDDDLPRPSSKLLNGALNWDYLLNWGPNFEKLVGVFKDIADLPDGSSESTDTKLKDSESGKVSKVGDVDFVTAEPTNSQVREEYV